MSVNQVMIENLENNLDHHQDHVEDDVGVDETLPVLPDPVDADGEEACPDEHQDKDHNVEDRDKIVRCGEEGTKSYDEIQGGAEEEEAADHLNGEEEVADDPEDSFNSAKVAGHVPLDETDVHDEQDEEDDDCDNSAGDGDVPPGVRSKGSQENAGNDGQDADDDPRPPDERDGRGDSHLAAEAVALHSELVQHVDVSS